MPATVTTRVGIRELKAKLSHYLDRAAAGETIVVTHHGRAKAELRPASYEQRREQLIREGHITPGRGGLPDATPLRLKGKMTVEEVLAEDREE